MAAKGGSEAAEEPRGQDIENLDDVYTVLDGEPR